MESKNYIARLNEYAQATRSGLKYEDVCADGPDHIKTFTLRALVNGQAYPDGTGRSKKEAKQNAAKNAFERLTKESTNTNLPTKCPQLPVSAITYFTCWLNEYGQKNRIPIKASESTRVGPNNTSQCCQYVVGGREFPAAFGSTTKEAKEEAAKLAYQEIIKSQTTGGSLKTVDPAAASQNQEFNPNVLALCEKVEHLNMDSPIKPYNSTEINYIGILNHYSQKMNRHPVYKVDRHGPSHNPQFISKVVIDDKEYPEGVAKTTKGAKQAAAQQAWLALQEQSDWNSQVSLRSNVSEEDGASPTSTRESYDTTLQSSTTTDSAVFEESSSPPKMEESPRDVKPKRKIAANFKFVPVCINSKEDLSTPDFKRTSLHLSSDKTSSLSVFSRDFESIERIGKGGFGHVYMALRKLEQKYYAVKVVRSKAKSLREVGALADLQHPNIVRYFTAWIDDTEYKCDPTSDSYSSSHSGSDSSAKYLYIQMELCDKRTLKVWIDERNAHRDPRRREESLNIIQQILLGVEYIHSKKLIHRDLKPPNIMFGSDGEVKIGDFGLVTAEDDDNDQSLLERTKRTGTKSYMAPEQLNLSTYDRKVDIFALGLIFFELLWKISTGMEKEKMWRDVRSQMFPQQFVVQFGLERKLIESMLCEKPVDRPEAKQLRTKLKSIVLFTDQNTDNKTV